jgi:hypothetical protein
MVCIAYGACGGYLFTFNLLLLLQSSSFHTDPFSTPPSILHPFDLLLWVVFPRIVGPDARVGESSVGSLRGVGDVHRGVVLVLHRWEGWEGLVRRGAR